MKAAKYSRRSWLKLIKVDPALRPSVFKTAYEICEYANAETGEFFVAAKTLAEGGDCSGGIAMSEGTVVADISKLEAAGYLDCIKRGQRGRGNSSHFRIVLKPQPAEISKPQPADILRGAKTSVSAPENLSIGSVKPQPAEMNLREPIEPKSAPSARRAEFVATATQISSCGTRADFAEAPRPMNGYHAPSFGGAISITQISTDPFWERNENLPDDEIPY